MSHSFDKKTECVPKGSTYSYSQRKYFRSLTAVPFQAAAYGLTSLCCQLLFALLRSLCCATEAHHTCLMVSGHANTILNGVVNSAWSKDNIKAKFKNKRIHQFRQVQDKAELCAKKTT